MISKFNKLLHLLPGGAQWPPVSGLTRIADATPWADWRREAAETSTETRLRNLLRILLNNMLTSSKITIKEQTTNNKKVILYFTTPRVTCSKNSGKYDGLLSRNTEKTK